MKVSIQKASTQNSGLPLFNKQNTNGDCLLLISCFHGIFVEKKASFYEREWNLLRVATVSTNTKSISNEEEYPVHDGALPLELPAEKFDAIYMNGIIEHLPEHQVQEWLNYLKKALRSGGILRISTPDMESIVRQYIDALTRVKKSNSRENQIRHHWIHLALWDQICRRKGGGYMYDSIECGFHNKTLGKELFGDTYQFYSKKAMDSSEEDKGIAALYQRIEKTHSMSPQTSFFGNIRRWLISFFKTTPQKHIVGSHPRETFEANKWLFDRIRLKVALQQAGFERITKVSFDESSISDWSSYQIDTSECAHRPFKPALFMECVKP